MMTKHKFRRNLIASAVASCTLAGMANFAHAQNDDEMLEEVIVTGIRASLDRSMDIKRDANGVVDAISAEDIGKFPDTNLAESLQRITGVSINRVNNEGSQVTVRGFGPDFNLVTLNNRQMPTLGGSRSFDFSDLAAESVSGVEVYKTFDATRATGGIGSLINIKTRRPLDNPGVAASLTAKAVMDTTNVTGDDVTPEIIGLYSNTFADDTFGVLLSASYQERDNRAINADVDNWRNNVGTPNPDVVVQDNRADGAETIFSPRNHGFGIEDIERERTNGQLVLQYAPADSLRATLDYTYSAIDYSNLRTGVGIWFNDDGSDVREQIIDENGTVVYQQSVGEDYVSNQRLNTSETENNSVGFNVQWDVTDNLSLEFDAHNSTNENGGVGRGNDAFLILGAKAIDQKTYDNREGLDIPDMGVTFMDDALGIVDGQPTAAAYDSLFGQSGINKNKSEVNQYQLDGVFDTQESTGVTAVEFGIAQTEIENRWRSYNTGQLPAGWYGGNQDLFPDDIFQEHELNGLMPSFSGGYSSVPVYHTWDFEPGIAVLEDGKWADPVDYVWGSGPSACDPCVMQADVNGDPVSDHTVTEDTTSAYIEFRGAGDIAGMALTVSTGLRYEQTDVVASSFQQDPTELVWINSTEWSLNKATESTYTHEEGEYEVFLPSFDAGLEVTDDVMARLSYSKSITRPTLNDMIGTFSVTDRPKPGERTGTAGNPNLKPFMADNIDISAEWYYADASYVSAGVFLKQVDNFIVNEIVAREVANLRDPSQGPRAEQATADLQAAGETVDSNSVLAQINANAGQPADAPVTQNNDDPMALFQVSQPVNQEQAKLYGVELAIQHMFSDTGFGVQANATLVDGDLDVDRSATNFQFALPGLSDSANLVAFYDKHGFQARAAYNWRDEFLNGIGQGNAPYYTEAYGQLDLNISYDLPFAQNFNVFVEAINVTEESPRQYSRYENQFKHADQYGARYNVGVRYVY